MADIVFPGQGSDSVNGSLPQNADLIIYKGDYFEALVQIKTPAGVAVPSAGFTGKAQLKTDYNDRMPIEFTVTATATAGEWRVFLASADTGGLVPGAYIWDFQITETATSNTRTYLTGDVTVYNEVTTA